jgi:hypothetical protein
MLSLSLAGNIREMSAIRRDGQGRATIQTCQLLARRQRHRKTADRRAAWALDSTLLGSRSPRLIATCQGRMQTIAG